MQKLLNEWRQYLAEARRDGFHPVEGADGEGLIKAKGPGGKCAAVKGTCVAMQLIFCQDNKCATGEVRISRRVSLVRQKAERSAKAAWKKKYGPKKPQAQKPAAAKAGEKGYKTTKEDDVMYAAVGFIRSVRASSIEKAGKPDLKLADEQLVAYLAGGADPTDRIAKNILNMFKVRQKSKDPEKRKEYDEYLALGKQAAGRN